MLTFVFFARIVTLTQGLCLGLIQFFVDLRTWCCHSFALSLHQKEKVLHNLDVCKALCSYTEWTKEFCKTDAPLTSGRLPG